MSRSTQFVGLTRAAEEFVKDLNPLPSCTDVEGMLEEKIPLRRWEMHPTLAEKFAHREGYIEEVVQEVPWSGGPLIFTHLVLVWSPEMDNLRQNCFEWVHDPTLDFPLTINQVNVMGGREFDEEKGTVWI